MKLKVLLLTLIFAVSSIFTFAGQGPDNKPGQMFELDEAEAYAAVSNLTTIEKLAKDRDANLQELGIDTEGLSTEVHLSALSSITEGPVGIPSIIWGFCLGLVGLLVVYLVTDGDSQETKSALIGCVAGTLLWGGLSLLAGFL
ncbi:MAG: hypothetical protein AAFR59_08745 [Bacteroidota bacterium]